MFLLYSTHARSLNSNLTLSGTTLPGERCSSVSRIGFMPKYLTPVIVFELPFSYTCTSPWPPSVQTASGIVATAGSLHALTTTGMSATFCCPL